jgi:hypothetical protein
MAQSTVLTLLPTTSHSGSNPINIIGVKQQAAAYTLASSSLQTVIWNLGANVRGLQPVYFTGTATIQASLSTEPGTFDWFDVYTLPVDSTPTGQSGFYNLAGSYVWIRAVVTNWTAGSIQAITVSY